MATFGIPQARLLIAKMDVADGEKAIKEWANCRVASFDADGDIWVEEPQTGHWLKDDALFEFALWANLNS